jgi:hypothetical protein
MAIRRSKSLPCAQFSKSLTTPSRLVRIVIAKPQSEQMKQMLVAKLGGLLNRRIFQMPFSRNLQLSAADARAIREMYEECIATRGVLLIQPEHILSFKLMAIECVLTDQQTTARSLLSTQEYLDDVSVDIVDESDANLDTKFELIYIMGIQENVELAPERWLICQQLLDFVPRFARQVAKHLPDAVDIQDDGDGKFPRSRFYGPMPQTKFSVCSTEMSSSSESQAFLQGHSCRKCKSQSCATSWSRIYKPQTYKQSSTASFGPKQQYRRFS